MSMCTLGTFIVSGFYPCFNGIGVLTIKEKYKFEEELTVSILVLMESGFLPVVTFGIAIATIIAHVFNF